MLSAKWVTILIRKPHFESQTIKQQYLVGILIKIHLDVKYWQFWWGDRP